jgi:ATP:ADP antiporter, AAA family
MSCTCQYNVSRIHVATTGASPSARVQLVGAGIYVISRAAKFSLFKPAEEMVYLSLDARARLNGKAAVDVLGAQLGKSGGSVLQQGLLIATAGSAMLSLPAMFAVFVTIAWQWGRSVDVLAKLVPSHTSMDSIDTDDEEDNYVLAGELKGAEGTSEGLAELAGAASHGVGGSGGPLPRPGVA